MGSAVNVFVACHDIIDFSACRSNGIDVCICFRYRLGRQHGCDCERYAFGCHSVRKMNASLPQKLTPNRSFFQVVCLLGYSLAPMLVASILGLIVPSLIARSIFVSVGFVWSTLASVNFVAGLVPDGRKALAVYPICLFFMCISWMVLISGKRS